MSHEIDSRLWMMGSAFGCIFVMMVSLCLPASSASLVRKGRHASGRESSNVADSSPIIDIRKQDWPQVKPGIWEIEEQSLGSNGKSKQWTGKMSQCHDPIGLFQGYWGKGIVERGGCRFQSTKVSDAKFKVTTECMVRHVGVATSEAVVTLKGDRAFVMKVSHREGRRTTTIDQTARWRSACVSENGIAFSVAASLT
jgi:hypothetical protein